VTVLLLVKGIDDTFYGFGVLLAELEPDVVEDEDKHFDV
jgi:hypothetical protein